MDYNKIFKDLSNQINNGSKYLTKQVEFDKKSICKYKIKLAVDKDDQNRKCVVLQLNNGGIIADKIINNINTLNSIKIDIYPTSIGEMPNVNYIIKLKHETDDSIFIKFVDDLVSVVKSSTNELIILDILKRVKAWMDFFKGKSNGLMTENSQIGLFAELYTLRNILKINNKTPQKIIESWVGPNKQNQDFIFPDGTAIEVKCTSQNNNKEISISNELQLDDKGLNKLFLSVYQVKRHKLQSGSVFESLINIVDEIKEMVKIDINAKLYFEELLIKVGYLEEFEAEYLNYGFQILNGPEFYIIDDQFPRIIRSKNLPVGLSNISYKLNIQDQKIVKKDIYKSINFK